MKVLKVRESEHRAGDNSIKIVREGRGNGRNSRRMEGTNIEQEEKKRRQTHGRKENQVKRKRLATRIKRRR